MFAVQVLTLERPGCVPTLERGNNQNSCLFFLLAYLKQTPPSVSLREGHSFLCLPKEKNPPCGLRHTAKERAALPLRQPRSPRSGTGGAKTRCAQTVCPFLRSRTPPPGSTPMAPYIPEYPLSKQSFSWRDKPCSEIGVCRHFFGTLERGFDQRRGGSEAGVNLPGGLCCRVDGLWGHFVAWMERSVIRGL